MQSSTPSRVGGGGNEQGRGEEEEEEERGGDGGGHIPRERERMGGRGVLLTSHPKRSTVITGRLQASLQKECAGL